MKKGIYIILICLLFNLEYIGGAQVLSKETRQMDDVSILEQIRNVEYSDWKVKDKVIKDIISQKLNLSEIEKNKLIEIFEKESKFQEQYVDQLKKQGVPINKAIDKFYKEYRQRGYADYFIRFTTLIFSFKNAKSIPSLLRALYYYGGAIVPTIIIAFGENAIDPLLECLNSKDRSVRDTSYFVLSVWVNAPRTSSDYSIAEDMAIKDVEKLNRIKIMFLKALNNEDIDVRSRAVFGLGAFPDENVVKILEEVSKSDPYSFYSKYEKKIKYPIREEAIQSIEKIMDKMKNKTETK